MWILLFLAYGFEFCQMPVTCPLPLWGSLVPRLPDLFQPVFLRATLKTWEWPGDEATLGVTLDFTKFGSGIVVVCIYCR